MGGFYSYFYLNGSRENKTFKFFLLDNMFDGDGRFYARCLWKYLGCESTWKSTGPGGGALPYMGDIGMCRCEGYGFQAVTLG